MFVWHFSTRSQDPPYFHTAEVAGFHRVLFSRSILRRYTRRRAHLFLHESVMVGAIYASRVARTHTEQRVKLHRCPSPCSSRCGTPSKDGKKRTAVETRLAKKSCARLTYARRGATIRDCSGELRVVARCKQSRRRPARSSAANRHRCKIYAQLFIETVLSSPAPTQNPNTLRSQGPTPRGC